MKPGERQNTRNQEWRKAGSSANGVANKWLAGKRDQWVGVAGPGDSTHSILKLLAFDAYSLLMQDPYGEEVLIFKGPGLYLKELEGDELENAMLAELGQHDDPEA
jgi:hypothetical protein